MCFNNFISHFRSLRSYAKKILKCICFPFWECAQLCKSVRSYAKKKNKAHCATLFVSANHEFIGLWYKFRWVVEKHWWILHKNHFFLRRRGGSDVFFNGRNLWTIFFPELMSFRGVTRYSSTRKSDISDIGGGISARDIKWQNDIKWHGGGSKMRFWRWRHLWNECARCSR